MKLTGSSVDPIGRQEKTSQRCLRSPNSSTSQADWVSTQRSSKQMGMPHCTHAETQKEVSRRRQQAEELNRFLLEKKKHRAGSGRSEDETLDLWDLPPGWDVQDLVGDEAARFFDLLLKDGFIKRHRKEKGQSEQPHQQFAQSQVANRPAETDFSAGKCGAAHIDHTGCLFDCLVGVRIFRVHLHVK